MRAEPEESLPILNDGADRVVRQAFVDAEVLHGQAAGVAAALCARDGVQPRHLDVRRLQRILVHELRSPLAEKDRLAALGLLHGGAS